MTLRFGTDGVRGVANVELTPELAMALGRAAARILGGDQWLIGRDTRRSGPMLTAALAAGLVSEGADVADLGVLPTPGVAFGSVARNVPAAMISASHNPFADNGIKLFSAGGRKLDDGTEQRLEEELAALVRGESRAGDPPPPVGAAVGGLRVDAKVAIGYGEHLRSEVLGGRRLERLRVVLDCANGAASAIAPDVVGSLGAEVTVIHAEPDGCNINAACGSTHPADLQDVVRAYGADVGLAFDGDADRVLAVDAAGSLVDGDHLIAMCAIDMHRRGCLRFDTVVVTVMSNLGFRLGMQRQGIDVVETAVGDRHVLEAMAAGGFALGGEQSGHVIFGELATTGDGLLTGLSILDLMQRTGRPLEDLAAESMTRLPQVLVNVVVARRDPDIAQHLSGDITAAEAGLDGLGRVLIRPSGTEPVVRVMVEGPSEAEARQVANRLAGLVEAACAD